MIRCPSCRAEPPEGSRFCPACAAPLGGASTYPTHASERATPSPVSIDDGRFTPGSILAGRYRVVSLVGRGGMGDVYRAEDLTLGHPVALKFLPEDLAMDPDRLDRFVREVRTARQITHPNVCRVHDIGEAEGLRFISMEYVDGEDLASLLRRIDRLPQSKAVQIARQICAGLAAAHEEGFLHRDLKPANVMIDGRGRARIADFGLSGLARELGRAGERAGTPPYMAPEQLARGAVSVSSDIYSLGCVLYELFTGKRPFEARSVEELVRHHEESTPTSPSSHVEELDPAVERVILRCLEKNPRDRPASALSVSAALPGGDPLAAALAAGETPSPELIAQSGDQGGLSTRTAWLLLIVLLIGYVGAGAWDTHLSHVGRTPMPYPPEVLADRAEGILERIGYEDPPRDSAFGFDYDPDVLDFLRTRPSEGGNAVLRTGRPPVIGFWYRSGSEVLVPRDFKIAERAFAAVSPRDPPLDSTGMARVWLDTQGRLMELTVVPREDGDNPRGAGSPPWTVLFEEAGLEFETFRATSARTIPPVYADRLLSWDGNYPGAPDIPIRVEAASFEGRPVSFRILGEWSVVERSRAPAALRSFTLVWLLTLIGSVILGTRNLLLDRVDRRGAFRLALVIFALRMGVWLLTASHTAGFPELNLFMMGVALALQSSVRYYFLYVAVEPYARRLWPKAIVSWSRLLSGRYRDPIIGRDILLGGLFGVGWSLVLTGSQFLAERGGAARLPAPGLGTLTGLKEQLSVLLANPVQAVYMGLVTVVLFMLLRVLLRRSWLASLAFITLVTPTFASASGVQAPSWIAGVLLAGSLLFILTRFGLLATVLTIFFTFAIRGIPMTLDLTSWHSAVTVQQMLFVTILAGYGFRISLAGRPMLPDPILQAPH